MLLLDFTCNHGTPFRSKGGTPSDGASRLEVRDRVSPLSSAQEGDDRRDWSENTIIIAQANQQK